MADDLAGALRALGRHLDVPPAPDVAPAVRRRLREGARPGRKASWRPALRYVVVALLVALSAALAVPPVRAAVLEFFRIGGVTVNQGTGPSPAPTPVLPDRPVADLAEAGRLTGLLVRPPAALGPPDEVRVIDGRVVSLGYRPRAGRPAVRLDVLDGRLEPVFEKYLRLREATEVDVAGEPGWHVPYPHEIVYLDAAGRRHDASARLAGATLIWHRAGTTYRLEAGLPLAELARIASSVPR